MPFPTGIDLSAEAAQLAGGTLRRLRGAFDISGGAIAVRTAAAVPGRVKAIQEHHVERMEMLRAAGIALGPATVPELSHEVFPKRHWGTMAESETFAHLEHMVHAGLAERWRNGDGFLEYRVAPR